MKSVKLQEMKWPDVKNYLQRDDRVILPVGSTEQHGPWCPIGTDAFSAICLAEDASEETRVIVAPPIWFGCSAHHMALSGTISIRPEVLIEFLYDEIESLARHGFKKFIIINGHRIANLMWMQIAAERAQRKLDVKIIIFDPAFMSKEIVDKLGLGPMGHADDREGSQMLYKYPHLVDVSKAKDYVPEESKLYHIDPIDCRDTLCYVPGIEE
ncbi:unnamed protein product, partial [marine sediment metagenome]